MNLFGQNSAGGAPWWLAPLTTVGGSVATIVVQVIAKHRPRMAVQADMSDKIADSFTKLVDQLQEENGRHRAQIQTLTEDAERLRRTLNRLRVFAHALFGHIAKLEALVRSLGGAPLERPDLPDLGELD